LAHLVLLLLLLLLFWVGRCRSSRSESHGMSVGHDVSDLEGLVMRLEAYHQLGVVRPWFAEFLASF
jgi:hypothetical protein